MSSESPACVLYDSSGNQLATAAGTAPSSVITIQGNASGTAVPISSIAISTTAAAVPASAMFVGGEVQTLPVGLTTGDLYPLSLTTAGLLRVDGSNVTQPVVGTGTAGSPGTAVLTIQGIGGGTSVPVTFAQSDTTAGPTALGVLNATIQIAVSGDTNAAMLLAAGTLVGTITPEVSVDGGTTWISTFFIDPATNNVVSSIVFGSSNTVTTRTFSAVGGASHMRVRVSAYTSGTANASLRASTMQDSLLISGGSAGGTLPPVIEQIGGSVTTSSPTYTTATINALSLDTAGNLRVLANAGSGNFTVVQTTATNLNAAVVGTGTAGSPSGNILTVQGVSSMTPINVLSNTSTTGTMSSISGATSSTTLLASNVNRKGATIYNDTASGNLLYVGLSATAVSTSNYSIKLWPGSYYDLPINYTGQINGIWTTAAGNARITELT